MNKILMLVPPSPYKRNIIRQTDCSHEAKAGYLWHPYDLQIISALLSADKGITLEFIDGTADKLSKGKFYNQLDLYSNINVIFFAMGSAAWDSDMHYFKEIRKIFQNSVIFVLGDIFLEPPFAKKILNSGAEGIVYKPHAIDILQINNFIKNKTLLLDGICTDPNHVGFPDKKKTQSVSIGIPRHDLFDKPGYRFPFAKHFRYATVTTTWGCPYSCSYCTDGNIPATVRSNDEILQELILIKTLGIKELFFSDKVFGFPVSERKNLLRLMIDKKLNFSWSCYFHPSLYDQEFFQLMSEAGCHTIITGIDSADLESLRKYNRHVKKNTLHALLDEADKLKINVCADFIIGLDHETENDINNTIEYALQIPIDFASFNIAAPLPGSSIRINAINDGRLEIDDSSFDTLGKISILRTSMIDSSTLLKLRNKAIRRFYLRPSYILRRIRRTNSFQYFVNQLTQASTLFKNAS